MKNKISISNKHIIFIIVSSYLYELIYCCKPNTNSNPISGSYQNPNLSTTNKISNTITTSATRRTIVLGNTKGILIKVF